MTSYYFIKSNPTSYASAYKASSNMNKGIFNLNFCSYPHPDLIILILRMLEM